MGGNTLPPALESAQDLYEDAPFGYVSSQAIDGPILQLNRTLCRWTGYQVHDIVGIRRFGDLLSPAGRIVHATRHIPLLQTAGAADGIALELVRADGSRFPVLMNSVVRYAPDGTPRLTRTALFDATAYRRYETQLIEARNQAERSELAVRRSLAAVEAADRGKARFIAAMNHEFRTPIGIISGFAELLQEAAEQRRPVPMLEWTRDIAAAAAHLLELLQDTTRYASIDGPGHRLERRPTSLPRTARAGLARATAVLNQGQIAAKLDESEEIAASLDGDLAAEAVASVMRELARRAGAGATLRLCCLGAPARIEVFCATLVLSSEAMTDFQDPLNAEAVLNRGLEGAGLGIALARRIAILHGGELHITSGPDGGILVTLSFGPVGSA
jgi:PAS domain S-box-containing protein